MTENKECNYNPDTKALTLCPDMARQLSPEYAGRNFQLVFIDGSPAIVCDFEKDICYFCPFCGQKLMDKPDYSINQWR